MNWTEESIRTLLATSEVTTPEVTTDYLRQQGYDSTASDQADADARSAARDDRLLTRAARWAEPQPDTPDATPAPAPDPSPVG